MTEASASAGAFTFEDPTPAKGVVKEKPPVDPIALEEWLRELIWTGASTAPRSMQKSIGMSEVGINCDREIAYKAWGTAKTRLDSDPMASLTGSGIHLVLADMLRRMDVGVGRWLIEQPVSYRGIPGSLDAYDKRRRMLLDWKSTSKSNLRKIRLEGPPERYIVQTQLYLAALRELGEDPLSAALVYIARDGGLSELYVWPIVPDQAIADAYVDRLGQIQGRDPADVIPNPSSETCRWCDFHRPGSHDLSLGCPGR